MSLREASGEQIRWAKEKAALTLLPPDCVSGGDFNCSTRIVGYQLAMFLPRTRAAGEVGR
jgi:hypothetical protein